MLQNSESSLLLLLYGLGMCVGLWIHGRRINDTIRKNIPKITPTTRAPAVNAEYTRWSNRYISLKHFQWIYCRAWHRPFCGRANSIFPYPALTASWGVSCLSVGSTREMRTARWRRLTVAVQIDCLRVAYHAPGNFSVSSCLLYIYCCKVKIFISIKSLTLRKTFSLWRLRCFFNSLQRSLFSNALNFLKCQRHAIQCTSSLQPDHQSHLKKLFRLCIGKHHVSFCFSKLLTRELRNGKVL